MLWLAAPTRPSHGQNRSGSRKELSERACAENGAARRNRTFILLMLGDENLRRQLGQNARARAQRMFSTEAMMRGVMEVYESVLARRRAA